MIRIFAPLCAVLLLVGCTKPSRQNMEASSPVTVDDKPVTPIPPPPSPYWPANDKSRLNRLFDSLRTSPFVWGVSAGSDDSILGPGGTKLRFYPHSFKDKAGNIVTSGVIYVSLWEMYKPGDVIANRSTTQWGSNYLNSAGQVYLTAKLNGEEMTAFTYGISFLQRKVSYDIMSLYYGNNNNSDSVTTWGDPSTDPGTVVAGTKADVPVIDSNSFAFDSCHSFHWVNCDYFRKYSGTTTEFTLSLPDTFYNHSNTEAFLVLPDDNAVLSVPPNSSIPAMFSQTSIFVGRNYKLVTITNRDNVFYYFDTSFISPFLCRIKADMKRMTASEIKKKLSAL